MSWALLLLLILCMVMSWQGRVVAFKLERPHIKFVGPDVLPILRIRLCSVPCVAASQCVVKAAGAAQL
jgi:hypothetical protein